VPSRTGLPQEVLRSFSGEEQASYRYDRLVGRSCCARAFSSGLPRRCSGAFRVKNGLRTGMTNLLVGLAVLGCSWLCVIQIDVNM
jgi:hypothetical protein